jgi:hypothetical protein
MENRVSENTAVVVVRREANTVLAMSAALVLRLLGKGGERDDILGTASEGSRGVDVDGPLEITAGTCDLEPRPLGFVFVVVL